MTETIIPGEYHQPGSKWHLAPDFTMGLAANTPISTAIDIVLQTKHKKLQNKEKEILVRNLESFVNGHKTIKYLNNLTSEQWDKLTDNYVPLICKIYLKHLLVQSFQYETIQQKLEIDFNFGIKIDFSSNELIDQMCQCGFSFDDSCEAVMVTDNRSVDIAVNYALLDSNAKHKLYEESKQKLNRMKIHVLRDNDYYKYYKRHSFSSTSDEKSDICFNDEEESALSLDWEEKLRDNNRQNNNLHDILSEINLYKQQLNDMKLKRNELKNNINNKVQENKLILYKHYVEGILSNNSLNIEQVHRWKAFREDKNISVTEHNLILKHFGFRDDDDLDKIKIYLTTSPLTLSRNDSSSSELSQSFTTHAHATVSCTTTSRKKLQCVVCYESVSLIETGLMLVPCNHICLCQECVDLYYSAPYNDQKCPLCCTKVEGVKKVYYN